MLIMRKFVTYGLMAAFILGTFVVVGGLGRMLTAVNAAWIVATGLGLAYVVDGRLKKLLDQSKARS
jgi:hypothetical protein